MINLPPIKGQVKRLCKCDGCGETKYTLKTEANQTMEVNKMTLCDTCRQEYIDWLRYWS
jgi:formylmethanofuran dehydrogenase subunit E